MDVGFGPNSVIAAMSAARPRRALHRLGDRLRVAEVVLLPPRVGPHIFGWHQPSVVAKRCEFAAQVMRAEYSRAAFLLGRETTSGVGRSPRRSRPTT